MRKKLCFLMSILFLFGICVTAKAGTPIADRQYNFSWEYDANGETEICHTGDMDYSLAWEDNGRDWSGVDVNCDHEASDCDECKDWFIVPDGNVVAFVNGGSAAFQLLDPNIDANVTIEAGKKYTMLIDLMSYDDWYFDISFYHSTDPCWIPDVDANEIVQESFLMVELYHPVLVERNEWTYDCKVSFVATPGADYIGDRLGIHLNNPYTGGTWLFADNIRLEWEWATNAYNPSPADGEQYVLQNKDLSWSSGLWADQHIIYFGTDWADVNERSRTGGTNEGVWDVNSFEPGTLELGVTYYWTVTEVNDTYISQPGVIDPPWIGDIWSFRVEGPAANPSPEDGADAQSIYTVLGWEPGTASESHDVYLGTDEEAVTNATTSSDEFIGNRGPNSYDPGILDLGQAYYWRIDEVRDDDGIKVIKGYIWSFAVAEYLMVDDMESYSSSGSSSITNTWEDYYENYSTAEIYPETDVNYVRDEQSMRYIFSNSDDPHYAETSREFSPAQDWTAAGFKVLALDFRADMTNEASAVQPMSVFISDGVYTGTVEYDDPNDLIRGWTGWQVWNMELQAFVEDEPLLDLSSIASMGIVIGVEDISDGDGDVYIDNIRLYPTRCVVAEATGSFTNDCDIDLYDLAALARDWLVSGIGSVTASAPNDDDLYGYWMMNDNAATSVVLDSSSNGNNGVFYDDVDGDEPVEGDTANHDTPDAVDGSALEFDGFDDFVELPAMNISTNTITITAWVKRTGDGHIYDGIVMSSTGGEGEVGYTAGLQLGADTSDWSPNYELAFMWTGFSWEWHTELFVAPDEWTFTALTVAPDVATIYLYDGIALQAARNYTTYEPKPWSSAFHIADQMQYAGRFFPGAIDEVRIYNRTLSPEEIASLAGVSSAELGLEPWRANVDGDDDVDLQDYAIMADNWLTEVLWP